MTRLGGEERLGVAMWKVRKNLSRLGPSEKAENCDAEDQGQEISSYVYKQKYGQKIAFSGTV